MEIKPYQPKWWKDYYTPWDWFFILLILIGTSAILCYGLLDSTFDWKGAVIGLIPTIPAGLIWFMKKKENWINALPSYMTVKLHDHNENIVGQVEFIPIQNNSDLRSQAQTVLKTLNNGKNLNLELFIRHDNIESQVIKDSFNKDEPCELKTVRINLTEPVEHKDIPSIQNIKANTYLKWSPLQNETKPSLQKIQPSEENA